MVANQLRREKHQRSLAGHARVSVLEPGKKTQRKIKDIDALFVLGRARFLGDGQQLLLERVGAERGFQEGVGVATGVHTLLLSWAQGGRRAFVRAIESAREKAHCLPLRKKAVDIVRSLMEHVDDRTAGVCTVDVDEPVASACFNQPPPCRFKKSANRTSVGCCGLFCRQ